jgi:S-adenosylmethionine/arginine decarboxylase-like enzyme
MEDVVTEIGIEKFRVAFTDNVSVMVKELSIFAGKYSHIAVYTYRLKSAEDTVDTCTCVVKEINKLQILRANFTESSRKNWVRFAI